MATVCSVIQDQHSMLEHVCYFYLVVLSIFISHFMKIMQEVDCSGFSKIKAFKKNPKTTRM